MNGQNKTPLRDELRQVWAVTTNAQGAIGDEDTFAGVELPGSSGDVVVVDRIERSPVEN